MTHTCAFCGKPATKIHDPKPIGKAIFYPIYICGGRCNIGRKGKDKKKS